MKTAGNTLLNREPFAYSHSRDLNFKISVLPWKSSYFLFKLQTFRLPTVWRIERDFQFKIDIRILSVPTGKRNSVWCLWILYIILFQLRRNTFHNTISSLHSFLSSLFLFLDPFFFFFAPLSHLFFFLTIFKYFYES